MAKNQTASSLCEDVRNSGVIKEDCIMYDMKFLYNIMMALESLETSKIIKINMELEWPHKALLTLFNYRQAGILISSSKSIGVLEFYLMDSHSCGLNGESVIHDLGRACIIECDTIPELERLCKQSTGS